MNDTMHTSAVDAHIPRAVPIIPAVPSEPKTELGRKLRAIRERIVLSGQPLLDWDEVEREVAERRGERPSGE